MANNVSQTPEKGILFGAGDEAGEFLFRRAARAAADSGSITATATARPLPGTATGPAVTPQAALPLPAAAAAAALAPAGAGGVSFGLLGGGGVLALFGVQQYQEAVTLNDQARKASQTDSERAAELQEDRNATALTALLAALVGGGLLVWALSSGDDGGATAAAGDWVVEPLFLAGAGTPQPALQVRLRW